METGQCAATHRSPTAAGEVEVRCTKEPGHDRPGEPDRRHEGQVGPFPIRWD
jgi:hypothetical protein